MLTRYLLVVLLAGCTIVANPGITFAPCVGLNGARYQDEFEGKTDELASCGWTNEVEPGAKVEEKDGDLVLRPTPRRPWSATSTGDTSLRHMRGDFAVLTRVEPAATLTDNRCAFAPDDGAGLVVRRPATASAATAWATLLVAPSFTGIVPCKDDEKIKPRARVWSAAFGFEPTIETVSVDGVGEDGESFIAYCRLGENLASFRADLPVPGLDGQVPSRPQWQLVRTQKVATGPLDVGFTAVAGGTSAGLEGHFQFALFVDLTEGIVVDGCTGVLENFDVPKDSLE